MNSKIIKNQTYYFNNTNILFQTKYKGVASCDVTPFKYICYTLEVTNLNDAP